MIWGLGGALVHLSCRSIRGMLRYLNCTLLEWTLPTRGMSLRKCARRLVRKEPPYRYLVGDLPDEERVSRGVNDLVQGNEDGGERG